jgi:hypothetical protein
LCQRLLFCTSSSNSRAHVGVDQWCNTTTLIAGSCRSKRNFHFSNWSKPICSQNFKHGLFYPQGVDPHHVLGGEGFCLALRRKWVRWTFSQRTRIDSLGRRRSSTAASESKEAETYQSSTARHLDALGRTCSTLQRHQARIRQWSRREPSHSASGSATVEFASQANVQLVERRDLLYRSSAASCWPIPPISLQFQDIECKTSMRARFQVV